MLEILQSVYDYFKNDNGKDALGNWLDDYDHRTYAEILGTDSDNFHKKLVPTRQPALLDENVPLVAFYTIDMPPHARLSRFFKIMLVEFDIYTTDASLEENLRIAKRHFQLLEGKILPTLLAYAGEWHHETEMQLLLSVQNFYCYAQRFALAVKRENLVTKRKK